MYVTLSLLQITRNILNFCTFVCVCLVPLFSSTQGTSLGAFMSVCALVVMIVLFLSETIAFSRTDIVTSIEIDRNSDYLLDLNFNITFHEMHCDFLSVDVWDSLGTNKQNVTKNVEKWQLDSSGKRRIYSGRNREAREVKHEEHDKTLEELHANGVHVATLGQHDFKQFIQSNDMVFVNFFAPWCVWCQRFHPIWEMFAEELEKEEMPVKAVNVNCVEHGNLCRELRVMAFPSIRWYQNGRPVQPDYKQDRTVKALINHSKRKLQLSEKYKDWDKKDESSEMPAALLGRTDNPGCQVSGTLKVNRVPGNFHVLAHSKGHSLNAAMTNLTHKVNHLSFGEKIEKKNYKTKRILKQVPEEHKKFNQIDGELFPTEQFHQAYHHYIKVVSTHYEFGSSKSSNLMAYQFLEQSQIMFYAEEDVPQALFAYDISPMGVVVRKEGRAWYDYLTSLCAIIGGSFTTLGLIDAAFYKIFKPKFD